jgi:hypothetical protein
MATRRPVVGNQGIQWDVLNDDEHPAEPQPTPSNVGFANFHSRSRGLESNRQGQELSNLIKAYPLGQEGSRSYQLHHHRSTLFGHGMLETQETWVYQRNSYILENNSLPNLTTP